MDNRTILAYWIFEKVCKYDMIRNFSGYGNFPGYGRPDIKMCRKACRNPGYEKFPGYGNYPGYGS